MQKKVVSCFYILLSLTLLTSCSDNEVLATYKGGVIKRSDLRNIVEIYKVGDVVLRANFQKKIVKQLALTQIIYNIVEKDFPEYLQPDKNSKFADMFAEGQFFEHNWKSKQDTIPEKIYDAHAIVLDNTSYKSTQLSTDEGMFNSLLDLRNKILTMDKKITPETLSKIKIEGTTYASARYRAIGLNTSSLFPRVLWGSLFRLSSQHLGDPLLVTSKSAKIYNKQDEKSKFFLSPQLSILTATIANDTKKSETASQWIKCTFYDKSFFSLPQKGYILVSSVRKLEKEKSISYPIYSESYGWMIFSLNKIFTADKDDFADIFDKPKGSKENPVRFNSANLQWQSTMSSRQTRWENSIFEKYGLSSKDIGLLEPNWQKKEFLLKTDKIKVTSKSFMNYLNYLSVMRRISVNEIITKDNQLRSFFRSFVRMLIFSSEMRQTNLINSEEFQRRLTWDKKNIPIQKYFLEHWYKKLDKKDTAVASIQKIHLKKEEELLKAHDFQLYDDKIKDGKL